jgi:hypothetical protein
VATADCEASIQSATQAWKSSPLARNIVVPGTDALFASSWPGTVVARAGIGVDGGRAGADKSQRQCAVRQQSIGRGPALWHCAVAGSHHSARVGKLPMSETTTSIVTTLKALRISDKH